MPKFVTQYTTIASGQTLSGIVGLSRARDTVSVWLPVVTSCQAYLQASFDTTSANFYLVQNTSSTSTFVLTAGPGTKHFSVPVSQVGAPYMRVQVSVAQTGPISLCVLASI